MNADRLLDLYDRISEAPDAVGRLRRFVLDLAVRGKLLEQDSEEEPASEMLKRLGVESCYSGKSSAPSANLEQLPFDLPTGWISTTMNRLVRIVNGRAYKKRELLDAGTPVLRVGNLFTSSHWYYSNLELDSDKYCDDGDLIYAWSASFGPFIWHGPRAIFHYHIWKLPIHSPADTDKHFLYYYLLQKTREIKEAGHGISMAHMTKGKMERLLVPVPPLAEQHRIVAKMDELMALCDRLKETHNTREATRDRLTTASLARLTAADTDEHTFQSHARFALDALPALTARPDQIKTLRQSILDLAVRGKLVDQNPEDEPASTLLKRITVERANLVKAGKFKTLDGELPIESGSFPFSIPRGWAWCYLNDLAAIARGGSPRPIKSYITEAPDGIPWIKIGDSKRGSIYIDETRERIRPEGVAKSRLVYPGDLLLSNSMSFGYPYISNVEGCIHDGWLVIRTPETLIDKRFLQLNFLSDHATKAFSQSASGAVVQNLNADKARLLLVPLPPLAEQHSIVDKGDELMALCDQLEISLAKADRTRSRLLEYVLHEALHPAADELEAA